MCKRMDTARSAPVHLLFQHIVMTSDEENLMCVNGKRCTCRTGAARACLCCGTHARARDVTRYASRNECAPSASAAMRSVASARFSICRTRSRDIPASCAIAS